MTRKGLLVHVLRDASGTDCTNDGVSSRFTKFVLTGEGIVELFAPTADAPELRLVRRELSTGRPYGSRFYLHAEPPDKGGRWAMFGGNFVTTSDSRFPSDYPIPVHDRFE